MSALEQSATIPIDRRRAARLRLAGSIPTVIGRGQGVIIDLSPRGLRVRHTVAVRRASNVRVRFDWQGEHFSATAEVLASQVARLGFAVNHDQGVPTMYESRLRFVTLTHESRAVLDRVLASVENRDVRTWVANLRGWEPTSRETPANLLASGTFLRCRLIGKRWEKKWTHHSEQPEDGFLVPESVEMHEVDRLCEAYARLDDDGRHLVRLIAAAVIAE